MEFDNRLLSSFVNHVNNHDTLNDEEKLFLNKIWKEASKFELWNYKDLRIGAKNSLEYIMEHYPMSNNACNKIVNAISYEWR